MLKQVHGEKVMSRARFLSYVNGFPKEGAEVEFDSWPGRPTSSTSDENVEKIRALMSNYRRLTVRMSTELNIKNETITIDF
jgi:hypothetical protein